MEIPTRGSADSPSAGWAPALPRPSQPGAALHAAKHVTPRRAPGCAGTHQQQERHRAEPTALLCSDTLRPAVSQGSHSGDPLAAAAQGTLVSFLTAHSCGARAARVYGVLKSAASLLQICELDSSNVIALSKPLPFAKRGVGRG